MADFGSPISPDHNNSNPGTTAGKASSYPSTPMTWQEMNDFLFRVQSGSLSTGAVGGISVAFQNSSLIDQHDRRRRREREMSEETQLMLSLQRQMQDMAAESMELINLLIKGVKDGEAKMRLLNDLWRQDQRTAASVYRVGAELERLKIQTGNNRGEVLAILQNGKNSTDPAIQRAAWVAEERYYSSADVITVSHRFPGQIGERPQHLVYSDAGRFYIKNGEEKLYLDTLPAPDRERMMREIERQRNTPGRQEKFGNEDPKAAERFEKANKNYNDELATAGGFIVSFDKLLSQGRNFRTIAAAKEQEYNQLIKDQAEIRVKIQELEDGFIRSNDSRRQLTRLKEILTTMEEKQMTLEREVMSFSADVEMRKKTTQYLQSGNFDNKTVLSGLPDDVFRRDAQAAQQELLRRLKQIEDEKAQLEANRENATRQEERTREAATRMSTLRLGYSQMDSHISRREWIGNMGGGSGTKTDYVRDSLGNVVHYDPKLGLFFRLETEKGVATPKVVHYRDPVELVDFFNQAWQGHKFLGNEKELGNITFKEQYDFIHAQLGRNTMMEAALRSSMEMKERLLENESSRLRQSLSEISAGGSVRPDVATDNPQKAAAAGIDPLTQSEYRPTFADAVTHHGTVATGSNSGTSGPKQGDPEQEVKKPVISITSDASR